MATCPQCHQTRYQVKDGFTRTGSQRMRCRACGKRYTPEAKAQGYADKLPSTAPTPAQAETVELDELYTFVRHKKTGSTS